jgi:hypothetical protein
MKRKSNPSYILDKSFYWPREGESDADFKARILKRRKNRGQSTTENDPSVLSDSEKLLMAAAVELGYLQAQ